MLLPLIKLCNAYLSIMKLGGILLKFPHSYKYLHAPLFPYNPYNQIPKTYLTS